MDNRQTNNLDNGLDNISPIDPNVNVPEEDLTDIFNTPIDEATTNLGVGEASTNYSDEIGEETEVLDINEPLEDNSINTFKEVENIVPLEVSGNEVNNEVKVNEFIQPTSEINNEVEVNNFAQPTNEVNNEVEVNNFAQPTNEVSNEVEVNDFTQSTNDVDINPSVTEFGSAEQLSNNINNNIAPEVETTDSVSETSSSVMQPNVMNEVSSLNPVDLPSASSEPEVSVTESTAGNQDFLMNQDPTLVPPTLNTGMENFNEEEPKKKKKNKFILPIIIVVAVLAILAVLYFVLFTGPKRVFDKAIAKGFDALRENIVNPMTYDTVSGKGSFSYELKATDENMQSVLDMFNGIALDYEYAADYKNKLMSFDLHSTYNSDKLLDASIYCENNKMYILLKDIYAKYISSDVEISGELFNTADNKKEFETILNSAEKALTKALVKDDFVKSSDTIKVNGKDVKVTKNALVLTNANFNRISRSILTTLRDDADFISAVNKISSDENVDTKAALEDAIDDIGEVDPDDKATITIAIYTKGILKDVVKVDFELKDEEESALASITMTADNNYVLVVAQNNKDILTGNIKTNNTKNDKGANSDMEITIDVPETINVKLNIKSSVSYNAPFNKVDVTNSVDYNALTEADYNAIGTKLMENKGLANLINNFSSMFGGLNSSDNSLDNGFDLSNDYNYNYGYNNYGV